MLRIYPVVLELLKALQPTLRKIESKDRDLARQLRRCSASVALNLAEGMYSRGGNRNARYHSALGSARETLACLEVAAAFGYVAQDAELLAQLNRVVGTLVRLVAR
jgi:four helix bundle protein